ncbi:MAG: YcbK family protein [Pseudomonadota bacterium]
MNETPNRLIVDDEADDNVVDLSRRSALISLGVLGTALAFSPSAIAGLALKPRTVRLYNVHTGDSLKTVYYYRGKYSRQALRAVNYLMRDFRARRIKRIDPRLLDLLWLVQMELDSKERFQVVSGYRTRRTNRKLREMGVGVAKRSYHTRGRAVDLRLPGRDLSALKKVAQDLKRGGVGYYPKSNFVHLDTGRVRSWRV